jgi:hypothetical protein
VYAHGVGEIRRWRVKFARGASEICPYGAGEGRFCYAKSIDLIYKKEVHRYDAHDGAVF